MCVFVCVMAQASVQTARLENQDILEKLRASDASKEGIWRQLQQMEVTVRAAQLAKDHAEAQVTLKSCTACRACVRDAE